ncbi:MAG: TonB-dependent receptor, partial [Pyrinomonadaceae bacterium]|nr:TonB-dependent receptor [Pyrinomonadaceae bacterium]
ISNFIRDIAQSATITLRIPGGDTVSFYRWWEFYAFAQDEWRVRDDLVVTFGARYEYSGDVFRYLKEVNQRVIAANGNNAAFRYAPQPKGDTKKLMPRLGFIWNPRVGKKGILGFVTGGDKLVMRAGYSRNYDANFINIPQNVARFFPFVANQNVSLNGAFQAIRNTTVANITQPNRLPRTIVSEDFRAPAADQFSVEVQRELTRDIVLTLGYIRTRGTRLMQTVDGNPCLPERDCRGSNFGNRVDPNLEAITLYTNAGSSSYDAMQVSLTKRLSRNLSAGLHYTWSTFIDEGSDVFAPSSSEISVAQNPFDRRSERARSSYDRPHRLTGNFVYELPFYRRQKGAIGRLLGGWQVNSFFTFQSGAPFSVTLGADPACAVCGIAATVRPNLNTNLDLSSMTIDEILAAGGANLFRGLFPGQRVGDAGRNILRTDNLKVVDFGFIKNTRLTEDVRVQLRADMFNAFNSRNFGIPLGTTISGLNFLNKWATDGGNRRIVIGARLVF